MRIASTSTRWLAVGSSVADALEAARPGCGAVRTTDVHAALLHLVSDGASAVAVAQEHLLPRPRAALRALARAARPHPVVVLAEGAIDGRVERAARALGARVAKTGDEALTERPAPRTTGPSAPRPAAAPAARPPLAEVAFVDGCFRRLDRCDDLCRYVLGSFARATGARRISLMLVDAERTGLFVKAAKGIDPALVSRLRAPLASGIAGRVTSLARALSGRATAGGARGYAGTAYTVLPLGVGSPCEGVVALTDFEGDRLPSSEELRVLLRMARRAGRAIAASRRLEQAEAQSATDELTGLPNRRAFERALHREVERARRSGLTLAVALFDVDHFKLLNDRFGHPVGDRVLSQVARRLASAVRETDLVCRWGGEEFALLLTGLADGTPDETLAVVERARSAVDGKPLALGPGLPCPIVSVSGGVAMMPRDGTDGASLVHRADAALYEAKRAGRNRVEFARSGPIHHADDRGLAT